MMAEKEKIVATEKAIASSPYVVGTLQASVSCPHWLYSRVGVCCILEASGPEGVHDEQLLED